jgi:DNA-binding NarL/FixJ family response regulator
MGENPAMDARGNGRRVVLADARQEVRSALRLLLEQEWDVQVIGEAATAAQLLDILAGDLSNGDGPLVLVDWELPGMGPVELLSRVRDLAPRAQVAALGSRWDAEQAAREAGADYFVSKAYPPEKVLRALAGSGIGMNSDQSERTREGGGDAPAA